MQLVESNFDTITVVSFDLDDTFWDCAPAIANAERALYAWHEQVTPKITQANTPDSLAAFRTQVRREHVALQGCVSAMRVQGLKELLSAYDYPQELAHDAFDVFYKARSEVVLYPLVHELLKGLQGRYGLAAITNGNADLNFIGISSYFDKILGANLKYKAKPHRDMFDRCCRYYGVEPKQVLHIGDNPVADVQGAQQAGMQTLWFNQGRTPWPLDTPRPNYEVSSIPELTQFFKL